MDNVQDVHELSLVLVHSLDHDIEQGVFINDDAGVLVDPLGESLLVSQLDLSPSLSELGVFFFAVELLDKLEVDKPVSASQGSSVEVSKFGVSAGDPTSWGNTVSLVLELLGE